MNYKIFIINLDERPDKFKDAPYYKAIRHSQLMNNLLKQGLDS